MRMFSSEMISKLSLYVSLPGIELMEAPFSDFKENQYNKREFQRRVKEKERNLSVYSAFRFRPLNSQVDGWESFGRNEPQSGD